MPSRAVRHLDLVVLVAALPVFLLADLPLLGYATVAGAWLLQTVISTVALDRARAARDRKLALQALAGTFLARISLTLIAVVAAGVADEDAGVAAGFLAALLFTVHLSVYLIYPPFGRAER